MKTKASADKKVKSPSKNKKIDEKSTNFTGHEVRLYIPEEYKEAVYEAGNIERLKEVASFTMTEIGKNVTKFSTTYKLDKLRSVVNVLEQTYRCIVESGDITDREFEDLIKEQFKESSDELYKWNKDAIFEDHKGRFFTPRTENQKDLVDAIRRNAITIVNGAAGSGKSRIALVMALNALKDNRVNKIVIIRPLVAVGGDIGFLPGGVAEKVDPYNAPIAEAFIELIGKTAYENYLENEKIEIFPASFARGCNISDSFVIVDEAQNMDEMTLITLMTRICANTKMVITGDSSQDDRKNRKYDKSGLVAIKALFENIANIEIVNMSITDVQRSRIVKDILSACEDRA